MEWIKNSLSNLNNTTQHMTKVMLIISTMLLSSCKDITMHPTITWWSKNFHIQSPTTEWGYNDDHTTTTYTPIYTDQKTKQQTYQETLLWDSLSWIIEGQLVITETQYEEAERKSQDTTLNDIERTKLQASYNQLSTELFTIKN